MGENTTFSFNLPTQPSNLIKVIGLGGGGCNAVNFMHLQGIKDVDFMVCNTDFNHLELSNVPTKVQLGRKITEGLGAGAQPDRGREATIETLDEIRAHLSDNTKMVFITAGMGGGTGTGSAPIVARMCKEMGILTVGIVTMPFKFEGKRRFEQANAGLEELKQYVDTIIVVLNDKLRETFGNLPIRDAFGQADNVLSSAAKGIAEIITVDGYVNVDFSDVKTVLTNSGVAIMGSGEAEGENRAINAIEMALNSPLLNDTDIRGAKNILLNVSSGNEQLTLDEMGEIVDFLQDEAGLSANVIFGNCTDLTLDSKIRVTVIATGFETNIESRKEHRVELKVQQVQETETVVNHFEPKQTIVFEAPKVEERNGEEVIVHNLGSSLVVENEETDTSLGFKLITKEDVELHIPPVVVRPAMPVFQEAPKVVEPVKAEPIFTFSAPTSINDAKLNIDRALENAQSRVATLKGLNNMNRPYDNKTVEEYENEPAYRRQNTDIEAPVNSSSDNTQRYYLSGTDSDLRSKNSYLHDRAD